MKTRNTVRRCDIYNNGSRLALEITEYKTLYKAEVLDDTKFIPHIATLRVTKTACKGGFTEAAFIFRDMCINNKYF